MGVLEIPLDEESFDLLSSRGRSQSFQGSYTEGQSVLVTCGEQEQPAVLAKAGRRSWVAKKPD